MSTKITTNWQDVLIGKNGTSRITNTTDNDNLTVLSIVPETDTVVSILTLVDESGNDIDAKTARNLSSLKAGITYLAGRNCYFKKITLTSGNITINE